MQTFMIAVGIFTILTSVPTFYAQRYIYPKAIESMEKRGDDPKKIAGTRRIYRVMPWFLVAAGVFMLLLGVFEPYWY